MLTDLNKLTTTELIEMILQVSRSFGNLVNIERVARGVPTEIGRNENTILLRPRKDKFGELVANDEEAATALHKFLSAVGDAQNSKPGNDGNVPDQGTIPDSPTH